jgi:hypothetical protein
MFMPLSLVTSKVLVASVVPGSGRILGYIKIYRSHASVKYTVSYLHNAQYPWVPLSPICSAMY